MHVNQGRYFTQASYASIGLFPFLTYVYVKKDNSDTVCAIFNIILNNTVYDQL